MGLRDSHKAFQEWFTAKRRPRAGGTLLVISVVGSFVYPWEYWIYVMIPGLVWFFSAWPPRFEGKR